MGLKIGRGGRVAAATVFATLLLSVALASAFKLAPRAQPAYAPCSCAARASASPGAASGAASVEWLNGSGKASAVEKALSLEEFGNAPRLYLGAASTPAGTATTATRTTATSGMSAATSASPAGATRCARATPIVASKHLRCVERKESDKYGRGCGEAA